MFRICFVFQNVQEPMTFFIQSETGDIIASAFRVTCFSALTSSYVGFPCTELILNRLVIWGND